MAKQPDQKLLDDLRAVEALTHDVKDSFVARDELVEMLALVAIAQEHLLVVGPPGTAKSEAVKRFAMLASDHGSQPLNGKIPYFEYLLTRFTEPNEIFGPVDIQAFQAGEGHRRLTPGMLPQAEIAFLDEVFKANSAILNSLLTVLNERTFYNGGRAEQVPLICAIGASNEVPEDRELAALYDRFLVRVWTDNVEEARFGELFERGWELEKGRIRSGFRPQLVNVTTTETLRSVHRALQHVNLDGVRREYREVVRRIRAEGMELSDRRVIKLLKLVAAAALRRRSLEASPVDFWVLRHAWNNPDQIPHLQAIVAPYVEEYGGPQWSAERRLETIQDDLHVLAARQKGLRTDADYADFLQQAERLRRELRAHSDAEGAGELFQQVEGAIDAVIEVLDTQP